MNTITAEWVRELLPVRPADSHKGTYGRLLVVGGCASYRGAPVLAGRAAYRSGTGLVTLSVHPAAEATATVWLPEATHCGYDARDLAAQSGISAVVIGPGMGQSADAQSLLDAYLAKPLPVPHVLDADALNMLAANPSLGHLPPQSVLTPHVGEMARLARVEANEVQADRERIATEFADRWGCTIVLKGAGTIVAGPGHSAILKTSNPALSVAGTGDVLSGLIGGMLAQGLSPYNAAVCGAFFHAQAGDVWRAQHGDGGLLAHELADLIPGVVTYLRATR